MNKGEESLVSVIIPAYNACNYISDTIRSVLNQEYQHFELIIVNDGSTDNTDDLISTFLSDKRIKYISQSNMGCSPAKNTGLALATGEFIQYLDADDLLSPDKINEQVYILKNKPRSLAVCRTKVFYESEKDTDAYELDTEFLFSTADTLEFILNLYGLKGKNGMIQPNAFLIPRELSDRIGPWNASISPSPDEDGEYFCRAILQAESIYFTGSGINYYRKHRKSGNSLSRQLSYIPARGALRSLHLITTHMLARENSARTRILMARHYANYMYLYSSFKDLCDLALIEIRKLGIQKIPITGGSQFKKMASLIGFENALKIKNFMHRKTLDNQ